MGRIKLLGLALALGLFVVPALSTLRPAGVADHTAQNLSGFLTALGADLTGAALAAEEGGPRIKQMKISVWPEYDEPRVLVMYDGELADKTGFPKQVRFRVPKESDIEQVCGINDKGEHLCQLFEVKQEADYNLLTYTIPVPHFFLEFYFSPVGSEAVRNIAYTYSVEQAADKIDVEVQQPLRATDFMITPSPLTTGADNQGFKYSQFSFEKVNPEQKIDLKISYSKQDNRPSVQKKQSSSGGGLADSSNLNIWLLLGGAAVLGLVAYFVMSRRPTRLAPQSTGYGARTGGQATYARPSAYSKQTGRAKAGTKAHETGGTRARAAGGFCTGCGTSIDADDRFCPKCGKRTKSAS